MWRKKDINFLVEDNTQSVMRYKLGYRLEQKDICQGRHLYKMTLPREMNTRVCNSYGSLAEYSNTEVSRVLTKRILYSPQIPTITYSTQ